MIPAFILNNMKTKFLLIFFYSTLVFSQNYEIDYGLKIIEDDYFLKDPYLKEMYLNAMEGASKLKFQLLTNDSISYFTLKEDLNTKSSLTKSALIEGSVKEKITIFKDSVYSNNTEGLYKKNTYLITEPLNKNWTLTTESKKIDSYTCYKATSEYIVVNPAGTFRHPVVAWYCPAIPISHGPNGFGGLPGLILEIQIKKALFGAVKIKETNSIITIEFIGEKIMNEEYQQKYLEYKKANFD